MNVETRFVCRYQECFGILDAVYNHRMSFEFRAEVRSTEVGPISLICVASLIFSQLWHA